jgi:hypothetical protein
MAFFVDLFFFSFESTETVADVVREIAYSRNS